MKIFLLFIILAAIAAGAIALCVLAWKKAVKMWDANEKAKRAKTMDDIVENLRLIGDLPEAPEEG